jgi:hypothetical protein
VVPPSRRPVSSTYSFTLLPCPQCSIRHHPLQVSRDFKGSAFIELADKDEMERVKEMAIEFEGAPLRMMPKREYLGMKLQARKERPNAQKVRRPGLTRSMYSPVTGQHAQNVSGQ